LERLCGIAIAGGSLPEMSLGDPELEHQIDAPEQPRGVAYMDDWRPSTNRQHHSKIIYRENITSASKSIAPRGGLFKRPLL
jgi:hypothetical protein